MKNNNTNTREIEFRRAHFKDEEQTEFLYFTMWGVSVGRHNSSFTSPSTVSQSASHIDQQYTGIKDKNEEKIFEGDILKGSFGTGGGGKSTKYKDFIFSISFFTGHGMPRFTMDAPALGNYRFFPQIRNCEIIGNVYQQPHLLTK